MDSGLSFLNTVPTDSDIGIKYFLITGEVLLFTTMLHLMERYISIPTAIIQSVIIQNLFFT
jgi:hypothetical protein